jgi:uncharacterized membrane protein YbhN (UPF0104 family)/tRNA A-37 threonylcarbamoyl transferase component Bud32
MSTRNRRIRVHATWGALFGVVPDHGLHRRASDVLRVIAGVIVVAFGVVAARDYSSLEHAIHSVATAFPKPVGQVFRVVNGGGLVVAITGVFIVAISSRRIRFIGSLIAASLLALGLTTVLQHLVDAPAAIDAAQKQLADYPQYPSMRLALVSAVFFVSGPELTRPSRRLMMVLLVIVSASALSVTEGYPAGILGSLFLGWSIAALVHLAFGSPDGAPDPAEVETDLAAIDIEVSDLHSSPLQAWGEKAYEGSSADKHLRIVVIGRDATDAQLLTKIARFVWYKDSGPTVSLSRQQQIEHRAYNLLLAERAGVAAPRVVTSASIGARSDSVLVLESIGGPTLDALPANSVTPELLGSAWQQLSTLHAAGIAHGGIWTASFRKIDENSVAFTDLATANADPDADAFLADQVALLVAASQLTTTDVAVQSAFDSLGSAKLADCLTMMQLSSLPRVSRKSADGLRKLCSQLRDAVSAKTGIEPPKLVEVRRVSPASIAVAGATILGAYLLIGELAHVDWSTIFDDARWSWVIATAVIAQIPILGMAMAKIGSVSQPLPLRPVIALVIGTKFTGLVGGGVTTIALVVRFFQKQGLKPAIAVTSGLLNSVASGFTQVVFLGGAILIGASSFSLKRGGSSGGLAGKLLIGAGILAVITAVAFLIPGLRHRLGGYLLPQIRSARENLAAVLRDPRKGAQLIGGNVIAQLFYAVTLWAALHAYGSSLGLVQLIVINSLASILGGIAPVPGGIGVIEAGLIGGFTAAGVPDQAAIAATFTARMFTAYLPPVFGWMSITWMRRRDYV